jgi:hypothetical protein
MARDRDRRPPIPEDPYTPAPATVEREEPFDYKAEFDRIGLIARVASDIDVDRIQDVISTAHTVMPIMDPTAYMRGMGNLEDQQELLSAFAPFARVAKRMIAKAEADRAGKVPT